MRSKEKYKGLSKLLRGGVERGTKEALSSPSIGLQTFEASPSFSIGLQTFEASLFLSIGHWTLDLPSPPFFFPLKGDSDH